MRSTRYTDFSLAACYPPRAPDVVDVSRLSRVLPTWPSASGTASDSIGRDRSAAVDQYCSIPLGAAHLRVTSAQTEHCSSFTKRTGFCISCSANLNSMEDEEIWQENPQSIRDAEWDRISSGFTNVRIEFSTRTVC